MANWWWLCFSITSNHESPFRFQAFSTSSYHSKEALPRNTPTNGFGVFKAMKSRPRTSNSYSSKMVVWVKILTNWKRLLDCSTHFLTRFFLSLGIISESSTQKHVMVDPYPALVWLYCAFFRESIFKYVFAFVSLTCGESSIFLNICILWHPLVEICECESIQKFWLLPFVAHLVTLKFVSRVSCQ